MFRVARRSGPFQGPVAFACSADGLWGSFGAAMFDAEGKFARARDRMLAEQLIPRGINDERVLAAMGAIPRHEFVPDDLLSLSYDDKPLPIGHGQTISQPFIVALMTQLLDLRGDERVLEIGAGCGYQSAILSQLAAEVCALELEPELAAAARTTLARLGIGNVDLRQGDGFAPWPGGGDFDRILCACAPVEVPPVLLEQLGPGGLLVLPVGGPGQAQELQRWSRDQEGLLKCRQEGGVRFVPMRHGRSLS